PIVPGLDPRQQRLKDPEEHRAFEHRPGDLGVPARGCREIRHHVHVDIDDAPAARGRAERPAIMHFTGIGCDDLAGVPAHDAATTEPLLRAVFQEPESVGVVPVTGELLRAVDVRAVHACERGGEDTRNVLHEANYTTGTNYSRACAGILRYARVPRASLRMTGRSFS